MTINDPETLAEATAAFYAYEEALLTNDTERLDAMFVHSDAVVRFGVAEAQYGIDEIRAFRATQKPFTRELLRTVITTYGSDLAITSTLFIRPDFPSQVGRQMQTWFRTPDGWRIAAAHVSMIHGALR